MKALVVEDSRAVRAIIAEILRDIGMEVVEAADGGEGLEQMKRHTDIELMLVDWNMPVMDGLEFIRVVRADPVNNEVRIMMVTTESEGARVSQALEAGANEYLMKPFTKEILIAKLNMMDVYEE